MSYMLCPICSEKDALQKLSAIVLSGQSSGRFSGPTGGVTYTGGKLGVVGGYSSLEGRITNELIKLLMAPSEPTKKGGLGFLRWLGLWYLIWAILFVFGGGLSNDGTSLETWRAYLFIFLFGLSLFLTYQIGKNIDRDMKKKNEKAYEKEKALWDEAIARWGRSYYCFRDHVVFDSETGARVPPEKLDELLYDREED